MTTLLRLIDLRHVTNEAMRNRRIIISKDSVAWQLRNKIRRKVGDERYLAMATRAFNILHEM